MKNHKQYITEILSKKSPKFGQKEPFLNFPIKCEYVIFSTPKTRLRKLANSNEWIAKKCKKPILRPILDNFWPKWAKREFFQKSAWNIFIARTSPN